MDVIEGGRRGSDDELMCLRAVLAQTYSIQAQFRGFIDNRLCQVFRRNVRIFGELRFC
jgi:hypothetical protein